MSARPTGTAEQAIVLLDEWVPEPRRLTIEEALCEWAIRYFRSHGPATVQDFAGWTKLRITDARTAAELARPELETITVEDAEYLMDPATPATLAACRRQASGVFLLPGFDEFVLGYADRGAALPAEYAERVAPGRNGVFLPTVVASGQIVGTWKRPSNGTKTPRATPFESFTDKVESAIPRVFKRFP